jgi:hypothetical protein
LNGEREKGKGERENIKQAVEKIYGGNSQFFLRTFQRSPGTNSGELPISFQGENL